MNINRLSLSFLLIFLMASCNKAPLGYRAPSGSSITISDSSTHNIIAGNTINVAITGSVTVPASGEEEDDTESPGNNIYLTLTCDSCEFINANNESLGTFIELVTNSSGQYSATVYIQSPFAFGYDTYDATVTADIGVASVSTTITAIDPNA